MKKIISKLNKLNEIISYSYITFHFNFNPIDKCRFWLTPSIEISSCRKGFEITIYFLFSYLYLSCELKSYLKHES